MNPWSITLSYIQLLENAVLLIFNFVNQLLNKSMNLDVRTLTLTLRINFFSDIRQTYLPMYEVEITGMELLLLSRLSNLFILIIGQHHFYSHILNLHKFNYKIKGVNFIQ